MLLFTFRKKQLSKK